jgi:hypothetical protein
VQQVRVASGQIECWLLNDGRSPAIVELIFEERTPDELADAIGPEGPAPDAPYNCLLVRAKDATILVDTGLGAAETALAPPSIRSAARAAGSGMSWRGSGPRPRTSMSSSSRTAIWITSAGSSGTGSLRFRAPGT